MGRVKEKGTGRVEGALNGGGEKIERAYLESENSDNRTSAQDTKERLQADREDDLMLLLSLLVFVTGGKLK